DTADSYSYDGNRQRSWNVNCRKYGDSWQSGDVITCGIDMDKRTISYMRNGKHLGEAFSSIARGKDCVYFPAMSLSKHEMLVINFGGHPLQYPMPQYNVLEAEPSLQLAQSEACLLWLRSLSNVFFSRSLQLQLLGSGVSTGDVEGAVLSIVQAVVVALEQLCVGEHSGAYVVQRHVMGYVESLMPASFMPESTDKILHGLLMLATTWSRESSTSLLLPRHRRAVKVVAALLLHTSTRHLMVDKLLFVGVR
ncbi:uncharacterized protein LOC108678452, partial [Hyalella azteca]|uniref:Uncharacterized protein LOC108678452 n=1 Tax=Hyalella azteca TaxID=294128 RepID=A0A8B7P978_HYAAZ